MAMNYINLHYHTWIQLINYIIINWWLSNNYHHHSCGNHSSGGIIWWITPSQINSMEMLLLSPYLTSPCLTLPPYLTLPYLTLPDHCLPYQIPPHLTFPPLATIHVTPPYLTRCIHGDLHRLTDLPTAPARFWRSRPGCRGRPRSCASPWTSERRNAGGDWSEKGDPYGLLYGLMVRPYVWWLALWLIMIW